MTVARRRLIWVTSGAACTLLAALYAPPSRGQAAEVVTIRLSSFAFTPDQIQLRVGVPVRLHLVNISSGGHNFSAPDFFATSLFVSGLQPKDGAIEVAGGESVDITLVPHASGTFRFECTHFLHSLFGMTGRIVVTGL